MKAALRGLLDKLPADLRTLPEYREIEASPRKTRSPSFTLSIAGASRIRARRVTSSPRLHDGALGGRTRRMLKAASAIRNGLNGVCPLKRALRVFDLAIGRAVYTRADGSQEVHENGNARSLTIFAPPERNVRCPVSTIKVAVITGAASGIGKEIALRFAAEGGIPSSPISTLMPPGRPPPRSRPERRRVCQWP